MGEECDVSCVDPSPEPTKVVDSMGGKDGCPSEVVDGLVGKDGVPSETIDVEDRRDVISSLVVDSVDVIFATAVDSPMTGKGEPGDSFPKS